MAAMANMDFGERQDRGRPRILIVDDNRDAADSLQLLLETMGYEAQVAYDGHAALRLAETTDFSVVLLDLAMPKMDGFELAARMRTSLANCPPIIAVTGWADFRTQIRARAAGCVCRLVKPVEIDELQRCLRSVASP
jgi:DNA-binding response OmpR family regulator